MKDKQSRTIVICRAKVRPQTETEMFALLSGAMLPFLQLLSWLLVQQMAENEGAEWMPHTRSPLAPRIMRELVAKGAFPGARKLGKTWLIRRAEFTAHVSSKRGAVRPPRTTMRRAIALSKGSPRTWGM